MRDKMKILLLVMISLFFSFSAFAEYAELAGKWVKINGPDDKPYIGVAVNKADCDVLKSVLEQGNLKDYKEALLGYDVLRVKNQTPALVLETESSEGKAKICLLSGFHSGFSGWVPIEWLSGNQERPTFTKDLKLSSLDY